MKLRLQATAEDHRIALLAAAAIGLTLAEAALPSPLPGVKPGLANIIILVVLVQFGLRAAIWVSLLRVVAGSLLFGTFLTPTFVLSFAGALASLWMLAMIQTLPARYFGLVSHSILAALAHIAAQVGVVYFWLIPHAGIAYLLPVFCGMAILFGTINGILASQLLQRGTPSPCEPKCVPHS